MLKSWRSLLKNSPKVWIDSMAIDGISRNAKSLQISTYKRRQIFTFSQLQSWSQYGSFWQLCKLLWLLEIWKFCPEKGDFWSPVKLGGNLPLHFRSIFRCKDLTLLLLDRFLFHTALTWLGKLLAPFQSTFEFWSMFGQFCSIFPFRPNQNFWDLFAAPFSEMFPIAFDRILLTFWSFTI